jgi:hypothetical protein
MNDPNYKGFRPELFAEKMDRMLREGRVPVMYDRPLDRSMKFAKEAWRGFKDQKYWRDLFGIDSYGVQDTESDWYKSMYPDRAPVTDRQLPPGAIRFDAYGNPQYGNNWWDDIVKRIDSQVEELNKKYITTDEAFGLQWNAPNIVEAGKEAGAMGVLSASVTGVMESSKEVSEVNQYFIDKMGIREGFNTAIGALKKAGWGILDGADRLAGHYFFGTIATAMNRIATGTPWAEQTPEWMREYDSMVMSGKYDPVDYIFKPETWAGFWSEADLVGDVIMGNIWDGLGTLWDSEGKESGDSSMRVAEYVRAAQEVPGTDLYTLERDINNPMGALLALPVDPLFLVQAGAGTLLKTTRTSLATKYATKLLPNIADAANMVDTIKLGGVADDVADIAKQQHWVQAIIKDTKFVREAFENAPSKPWSLTNGAKAQELGAETKALFGWVASKTDGDPDTIFEMLAMVAKTASDEAEVVEDAFRMVTKEFPDWGYLMTKPGRRAAINLFDLTKSGDLEFLTSVFKKTLANDELGQLGKFAEITGKIDEMSQANAEKYFPTLLDQKDIPKHLTAAAKTYDWLQTSKFGFKNINKFFSEVYLGYSPGYAVRNGIQNTVQTILDEGLSGISSLRQVDDAMEWMGAVKIDGKWLGGDDLIAGMKKDFGSMTFLDKTNDASKPWYRQNAKDAGQWLENKARIGIFRKKIPQTMRTMLRKNTRKALIKELGFDQKNARKLENLLIKYKGDVGKALDEMRGLYTNGTRRVVGSDHMPSTLRHQLAEFDNLTSQIDNIVDEGVKNNDTLDDVVKKILAIRDDELEVAKRDILKEVPTPAVEDVGEGLHGISNTISGDIASELMETGVPNDIRDVVVNAINVNQRVNREVGKVLEVVRTHAWYDLYDMVGRVDELADKELADLMSNILLPIPAEFGGQTVSAWDFFKKRTFGKVGDDAITSIRQGWDDAIDGTMDAPEEIGKWWKVSGMEKRHGILDPNMTWQDARKSMINEKWLDIKKYWEKWRDTNYALSRQWVDKTQEALVASGGKTVKDTDTLFAVADRVMERAKYMDAFLPRRFVEEQLRRGKRLLKVGKETQGNKELVLAWARQFGIKTATEEGVPLDRFITNILNKRLAQVKPTNF